MRKSSTASTSPVAKKFFHTRLMMARAKYGFSGEVSHFASGMRRSSVDCREIGAASSGVGGCALPRKGCIRSPGSIGENHPFAGYRAVLRAHAREEIGEGVVLVIRPFLHRVIVAFGAIDRHAEKGHRDRLRRFLSASSCRMKKLPAPFSSGAARGGEQVAHQFIPRRVQIHLAADPLVVAPHRLLGQLVAVHQQADRSICRPSNRRTPAAQAAHRSAGRACPASSRRETCASHPAWAGRRGIEKSAADELAIRAARRRREIEFAQLFQHALVDEIARLELRQSHRGQRRLRVRRQSRWRWRAAQIPRGDGAFAVADHLDHAIVIHRGHARYCPRCIWSSASRLPRARR